jgi:peptidoglycan/xylan/chitin deacetylase (PgdA/CDA1 family)
MVLKSAASIREQIERTDQLIRASGYRGQISFRAPFAKQLVVLPWVLWQDGRQQVLFDVRSKDTLNQDVEFIVDNVLDDVRPGSVILLHDGGGERHATVDATRIIIDRLREQGYRFVTVSEIMKRAGIL